MLDTSVKTVFDVPFGSLESLNDKWGAFRAGYHSSWIKMDLPNRVGALLEFFNQVPPASSAERWQIMWGDGLVSQTVCDARSYIFPFRKKLYVEWSWENGGHRGGGALSSSLMGGSEKLTFTTEIRLADGVIDVWTLVRSTPLRRTVTAEYVSANSPR